MSQMFKNYINDNTHIPDNRFKFIEKDQDWDDVLVLGGDNNHTLELTPTKSDIESVEITYQQGIEVKLVKSFIMDLFYKALQSDADSDEGVWLYPDESARLYVLSKKEVEAAHQHIMEFGHGKIYQSVLYYVISADETKVFNEYNQDFYCQAKITYTNGYIEFSKRYKIKPLETLTPEEEE